MSTFSDNMSTVSTQLITEFGETCSFSRIVVGSYDPATSISNEDSVTTFNGVCFQDKYSVYEIQNSLSLERDDIKVLVAPISGDEPLINDTITFSSITYRVLNISKVTTNGATVLFELQVRE